jgi:hypothetical protein
MIGQRTGLLPGGCDMSGGPLGVGGAGLGDHRELRLADLETAMRLRLAEVRPVVFVRQARTNIADAAIADG